MPQKEKAPLSLIPYPLSLAMGPYFLTTDN